ncbi:MAG TPA: hypothetical protein VFX37_00700 [Pseudolabrys sp.]|nr:hypothetical protein [Pseudolabrys sp.]
MVMVLTSFIATGRATTSHLAAYGEWEISGDVDAGGRIAYTATLHDHNDKRRSMQIKCWPSRPDSGFTFFLFDGAIKKQKDALVTFNNSRLGMVDQFETSGGEGYVDISRMFLELVGCGRCNPRTKPHSGSLLISVQNRKMEFNPAGADAVWDDIARRCHL